MKSARQVTSTSKKESSFPKATKKHQHHSHQKLKEAHSTMLLNQMCVSDLLMSKVLPMYQTDDYSLLFAAHKPYITRPDIKDRISFFLEENDKKIRNSHLIFKITQATTAFATDLLIKSAIEKGSMLITLKMENGDIYGVYTSVGWICGVTYMLDNECCGFIKSGGCVSVFELGNNIVYYPRDYICFGRLGVDFTINISEMQKNRIFDDSSIYRDCYSGKVRVSKIITMKVYKGVFTEDQ